MLKLIILVSCLFTRLVFAEELGNKDITKNGEKAIEKETASVIRSTDFHFYLVANAGKSSEFDIIGSNGVTLTSTNNYDGTGVGFGMDAIIYTKTKMFASVGAVINARRDFKSFEVTASGPGGVILITGPAVNENEEHIEGHARLHYLITDNFDIFGGLGLHFLAFNDSVNTYSFKTGFGAEIGMGYKYNKLRIQLAYQTSRSDVEIPISGVLYKGDYRTKGVLLTLGFVL